MINVYNEAAKYVIVLLMALYTWWNFMYFRHEDVEHQRKTCRKQNMVMFLMHLIASSILYLRTQDERMLLFYLAQVVFFGAYLGLYRMFYPDLSRILVNNMCMLLCIGFIMLGRLSMDRAIRQFVIVGAAALVTWIVPVVMGHFWQLAKIPWVYGATGLLALILVWMIGNNSFGAQLSINVGTMSFQPSEFVKITFVFFTAAMLYRSADRRNLMITSLVAAAHVIVLVLSRDLGSALLLFATYLAMLFTATTNWLYLAGGLAGGSLASVMAYRMFSHVRTRITAWSDPWSDIDNRGYQITQSLFAIGTGGWFGMGLCQGMPYKIPVVEKDFIFSAIAEELGGVFALCLLFVCIGCFLQCVMLALRMQAMFYKLIAFGLGVEYILQVFLTVGGVIKFIPSTGVTLPFVSYGGSSVMSTFLMFGIIQGLYILKKRDEEDYE